MRFVQGIDYGPRKGTLGFAVHMAEGGDGTLAYLARRRGESDADWRRRVRGVSANFVILESGEVVQMVDWTHASGSMNPSDRGPATGFYNTRVIQDVLGGHYVDPNAWSLSVEITGFRARGPNVAQADNLVQLIAQARDRFPTLVGAYGHADQTDTKGCPGMSAVMLEAWRIIGHGRFAGDDMPPIYATPLFSAIWPKGTPVYEDHAGSAAGALPEPRRLTVRAGNLEVPTRYMVSGADKGEMDWVPAKGYTDVLPVGQAPASADVTVEVAGVVMRGEVAP